MTCTKCQETGVYNEVMGQGFYYCRSCKTELSLEIVAVDTSNKSFEELMQGLDPYDLKVFWARQKVDTINCEHVGTLVPPAMPKTA